MDDLGRSCIWGATGPEAADLDPGTAEALCPPVHAFVACYAANGTYEMSITFHAEVEVVLFDIAITPEHDIVIAGFHDGAIDVDPGPGETILSGSQPFLLARYSSAGELLWAHSSGLSDQSLLRQVEVDGAGDLIVSGSYWNATADIDPGPGVVPLSGMPNRWNWFLAKFSGAGDFQWVRSFQPAYYFSAWPVFRVDADDGIWFASGFQDTVDVDMGEGISAFIADGFDDVVVAHYDADGALTWAGQLTGPAYTTVHDLAIDGLGRAILTGITVQDTVDLDPTGGIDTYVPAASDTMQGWWSIIGPTGSYVGGGTMGTNGQARPASVCAEDGGRFYLTGWCTSIDLNGDPYDQAGGGDAFVLAMEVDGSPRYAFTLASEAYENGVGIALGPGNDLFVSGHAQAAFDADPGPAVVTEQPPPNGGIFLARYGSAPLGVRPSFIPDDPAFWPVPVSDLLTVRGDGPGSWTLLEADGRVIAEGPASAGTFTIPMGAHPPGAYLLRTVTKAGVRSGRVVKQ